MGRMLSAPVGRGALLVPYAHPMKGMDWEAAAWTCGFGNALAHVTIDLPCTIVVLLVCQVGALAAGGQAERADALVAWMTAAASPTAAGGGAPCRPNVSG
jgi:hypothetical protein